MCFEILCKSQTVLGLDQMLINFVFKPYDTKMFFSNENNYVLKFHLKFQQSNLKVKMLTAWYVSCMSLKQKPHSKG